MVRGIEEERIPVTSNVTRSSRGLDEESPRQTDAARQMGRSREGYNSLMKTATISETKNQLSALLDRVRHGESILITDRSQPIARLEPVVSAASAGPDEGRLARLERAGVIRRARHGRLEEIVSVLPPAPEPGGDIVAVVLDDRRSGR